MTIRITIKSQKLSESLEDFTAIRDEDELEELQVTPHPYELANSVGIRISRASEFAFGLASDGKLAGALFTEIDNDVMMFDIVVDPTFRRLGIADKFIRYAIMLFRDYESDGLVESLSANVVNPAMIPLLRRHGFVSHQSLPGREIMMYQPDRT